MSPIPRGDDLTHAGRIKRLEEMVAQLARRDTVIADATGVARDIILLNDVTVPTVQAAITDGLPPASSPAAEVIGGIGSLFIRWTPVANANPVTYRVYVDTTTGFTEGAGNLVGSTGASSLTVRTLTAGTALAYGTTYYAKIVASDADGSALAGAEGSGSMMQVNAPDIAANAITAAKLDADAINGKVITGAVVRTAATGTRIALNDPAYLGQIGMFSGNANEITPALIQPILGGANTGSLSLRSPTLVPNKYAYIDLEGFLDGHSAATLQADSVQFFGRDRLDLASALGKVRIGDGNSWIEFSGYVITAAGALGIVAPAVDITGTLKQNTVPVVTTTDTQALTNKTLGAGTVLPSTVVQTTGAQTLSGKDLSSGNTFPSTLATLADAQALTNKDLTGAGNTFPAALLTASGTSVVTNKDLTAATNTFPAALATLTGTQTLTNKTLTSPTITGTGTVAAASATVTGAVNAGSINLGLGTTVNDVQFGSGTFTVDATGTGRINIPHTLGVVPTVAFATFQNSTRLGTADLTLSTTTSVVVNVRDITAAGALLANGTTGVICRYLFIV